MPRKKTVIVITVIASVNEFRINPCYNQKKTLSLHPNRRSNSEIYIKNAETRANRALRKEQSREPRWRALKADVGIRQKLMIAQRL